MIDRHIRRTKFHFSIGVILLFATLITGIATLKGIPYLSYDYLVKQVSYLRYRSLFGDTKIFYSESSGSHAESVPVLVYHGLVDGLSKDESQAGEGVNMSPDQFWNQMLALKRDGWNTISIYDFHDFMMGKKELPEKSFLLTFDDGRKDSYYPADPILNALGFHATMFVITERSLDLRKSSFYLSEPELKEMVRSGRWDIQSHGFLDHDVYTINPQGDKGHFLGNKLWKDTEKRFETDEEFKLRVLDDLTSSKNQIEQDLGVRVLGFAYPFSDYGDQDSNFSDAKNIVPKITESIYPLSFYQVSSSNGFGFNYPLERSEDLKSLMIKRIKFPNPLTGVDIVRYLSISLQKPLPYNDTFIENRGWYASWGEVSIENGILSVGARDSTSGGAVFLDGSSGWKDYTFMVTPSRIDGESVTLLAHYIDDNNLLECTYTDKFARIVWMASGERKLFQEVKVQEPLSKNQRLGVRVAGGNAQCLIDDVVVISGSEEGHERGVVGVKTWDPVLGKSRAYISGVYVEKEK